MFAEWLVRNPPKAENAQRHLRRYGAGGPDMQEHRLRPRLGVSAIFRCQCGGTGVVMHSTDWRNKIDREMGQVTRGRRCSSCGKKWHTVELEKSELQRLRRLAHLQVMSTAR